MGPVARDFCPPQGCVTYPHGVLTRIAPTPSGYLHAGNRFNFTFIRDWAQDLGARIALRIDDADVARYRREYVDNIFATLEALDIPWDVGPRTVAELETSWSQRHKTAYYRSELERARERGLPAYACHCSRSMQSGPATGGCVGGCRGASRPFTPGVTSLRVCIPEDLELMLDGHAVNPAEAIGDPVIWRRDDLPAYHLVSIVEDRDLGSTHIARGLDLLASSALQIHLAPWFEADSVARAEYRHHRLLTDSTGSKLSKSVSTRREDPT